MWPVKLSTELCMFRLWHFTCLPRIALCQVTSKYITSCHIPLFNPTSCQVLSGISLCVMANHIREYYVVLRYVKSFHIYISVLKYLLQIFCPASTTDCRSVMSICVLSHHARKCHFVPRHIMSRQGMSLCVTSLCLIKSCHIDTCLFVSPHITSKHGTLCHIKSRHVTTCHFVSSRVTSRHVMSEHGIWELCTTCSLPL